MDNSSVKVVGRIVLDGVLVGKDGVRHDWEAEVERSLSGYELFIKRGAGERTSAGQFATGEAVVKYLRSDVAKKFGLGVKAKIDTLHEVVRMKSGKAVPVCYVPATDGVGHGRGLSGCSACPYESICGEEAALVQPKVVHLRETDDVLVARLRAKMGDAS